jgi:hypothetical protein
MRANPGILKLFVLMVAVAVTLLIQSCAQFVVEVGHGVYTIIIRRPVPIKSEAAFERLLEHLKKPGVEYHFHLVRKDGTFKDYDFISPVKITTDRVITTEVAQSLPEDGLTPIGSSVTHRARFTNAADVGKVLAEIKSND